MVQHLRLFKQTPPNGLAVFSGNISEKEGQSNVEVWSIEPPIPLKTRIYRCDKQFVLYLLEDMYEDEYIEFNNKIINPKKYFKKSYPYIFLQIPNTNYYSDNTPCILKWLFENQCIDLQISQFIYNDLKNPKFYNQVSQLFLSIDTKSINNLLKLINIKNLKQ